MKSHLEIEFKNVLDRDQFQLLLQKFQLTDHHFFKQTNHYFDTKKYELQQQNASLRVREFAHSFELTLKKQLPLGALELNQPIVAEEVKRFIGQKAFPDGEIKNELLAIGISPTDLLYYGCLTTKRAEVNYKNGRLMFDHSLYFDSEDFEVEYEVCEKNVEQGKENFKHLLKELNIPIAKADHKIKRFFHARNKKISGK